MQDNVSVLIATILAVIIIVLFPIYNIATRQDSIANNMVVRATTNFVDEVRNKGYVDSQSYGNYLKELDKTGNTYEVEMEAYKQILVETVDNSDEYEEKYEVDYTNQILVEMQNAELATNKDSVITENAYILEDGDKFYVRVKNTNITQAQVLFSWLLGGENDERIVVNYGGVVYTNEWAKGDGSQAATANIKLSRPMNSSLQEYRYEYITSSLDQYTGIASNIYGIACRLSENEGGEYTINFRLTYQEIDAFYDDNGNVLTSDDTIINYLSSKINTQGFECEKSISKEFGENGKGNYSFIITLSNIVYDFDNNPFLRGTLTVDEGTAYAKAGFLGKVKSEEFIITYEIARPTIMLASTPDVINNNVVTPVVGGTDITFDVIGQLTSNVASVKKAVIEITNNGTVVENRTIDLDSNGRGSINYRFTEGTGSISAYVIDSRGNQSEKVGYGFIIMNNYLSASINTRGITEMNTVIVPNATISSYSFGGRFPSHAGSDWWRITGLVKDTTNTWETISGINFADGSNFNTGMINLDDPTRYIQLKFEYRTDPSHDGRSCLRGATIDYRVNYIFE